jgi:hypothetical protein
MPGIPRPWDARLEQLRQFRIVEARKSEQNGWREFAARPVTAMAHPIVVVVLAAARICDRRATHWRILGKSVPSLNNTT